ncbi:hypothetical protein BDR05DRAFT_246924 [Suillus weaverae]|nr:hypothetical protein BDR05DRAFT_246924 [Suillus weaverae]
MIPGKIIRINDKVTFKLWPKLEGKVIKTTSSYSMKLKPTTVSPYYPHPHPNQLEPDLPEVVITMFPLPKPTNIVKEAEEEAEEDSETSHYSSCSRDEDVSSLGTGSGVSAVDSSELDTHTPLDRSTIRAKEIQYWDIAPPAPPQWRSLRGDWRYCHSCESPHPTGELSRLLCVEVGLEYMRDCDGPTVKVGRKRKREE